MVLLRFIFFVFTSLLFVLANAQNNDKEKKLALVIGNAKYKHSDELKTPLNDARGMKAVLESLGFEVMEFENTQEAHLKKAIDEFGDKLDKYDVGLFYYSGHVVQSSGSNYIIPVEAEIRKEKNTENSAIPLGRVVSQMEASKSKKNIVILDACRSSQFERTWTRDAEEGKLAFITAPLETIIAYSSISGYPQKDKQGNYGLYTKVLLEQLLVSENSLLQVFQKTRNIVSEMTDKEQNPWESTSMTEELFLKEN